VPNEPPAGGGVLWALSSGDIADVLHIFCQDAQLETVANHRLLPLPFPTTKAELGKWLARAAAVIPVHFDPQSILIDGDQIAIEALDNVTFPKSGYDYANWYVFRIEARNGKIVRMRSPWALCKKGSCLGVGAKMAGESVREPLSTK
jgi:ketosteroid isomerase-like protein